MLVVVADVVVSAHAPVVALDVDVDVVLAVVVQR